MDIVKLLISKNANLECQSLRTNNFDALNLAIWCGSYDTVKYFLNENEFYDAFIKNEFELLKNEKFTSLKLNVFLAAECCHVNILKLFLKKGIKIHVKNENNLTPLHVSKKKHLLLFNVELLKP